MKRLTILSVCLFILSGTVMADDGKPVLVDQLPVKAQQFIKQHFPEKEISFARVEKEFIGKKYDVFFVNGEKLEFDKNGLWKEVDCKLSAVPDAVIPQPIREYQSKQYPDAKTLKIERESKGYEVKLNNRLEIRFDAVFQVVDIDD